MSAPEGTQLSKSARKRANKKARDSAGAEEEAEEAPKVTASKENTSANAKAAAKAAATIPQAEKPAQPKAKGKAAAAPSAPVEAPKAKPASKPAAKPASKASAKAKAKAVEEEEEPKKKEEMINYVIDDGTGGDWEEASGMSKKMQRTKERQQAKKEQEKMLKAAAAKAPGGAQYIPGMAPVVAAPKAKGKAAAAPVAANASVSAAAVAAKAEEPTNKVEILHSVTIKIDDDAMVARIIGPKGSTINKIKELTGITSFDMDGDRCTLAGGVKEVESAEVAVREILTKGYCSLMYEDFAEAAVPCMKIEIANIIGKGGEIISKIKDHCKVEVSMPKTNDKDPKSNPYKKLKITMAGSAKGVEECKDIINSILMYGHHEVTHPGVTHEELEIDYWNYSYIIGKGGSEMRHIQNNYKVKVNIPRENSTIQNVLIVGEKRDVERASQYIWKLLTAASEPKGRGAPDKAEDTWGDEGPEEEWMSQYMYKRT